MPIVNIICSICTEIFKNADEVFSTNCGHLFHVVCLNDWIRRDNSCPQCRRLQPLSHKMHLSFEESAAGSNISQEDIQVQIKSSEEKVAELLTQNRTLEDEFLKLQQQYSLVDASNRELVLKLSQMNDREDEFMQLQAQYTETAEIRKQYEDRINQLIIENECGNEQLPSGLEAEHFVLPNNDLGDKIRSIEQKLKMITAELEKEVNQSTLLSITNIKLQSYINNYHAAESKENQTPRKKRSNSRNNFQKHYRKNSPNNMARYDNTVVIKGLLLSEIDGSLENVVISLALKMGLAISPDDLVDVNIINVDLEKTQATHLSVQFKEMETKRAFLSHRDSLQNHAGTKTLYVEEFMSKPVRELFIYAKKMLHNRGLIYFCIEDNNIVAKKHRMHPESIYILNKQQVDQIASSYDCKKAAAN